MRLMIAWFCCCNFTMSTIGFAQSSLPNDKATLEILTAAGQYLKREIDAHPARYFVSDSNTARVLDRIGWRNSYVKIPKHPRPSCDGSSGLRGTLASLQVTSLKGDTAMVMWFALCVMRDKYGPEEFVNYGGGQPLRVIRVKGKWRAEGTGIYLEF